MPCPMLLEHLDITRSVCKRLARDGPFGRAAKPEEIGWMAPFLASDRSGYTTGSIITIDGGGSSRRSAL